MEAFIDRETCVGCGLCADTCSDVFQMEDGVARVIVDDVPPEAAQQCKEAVEACPVSAISVEP